ncbi:surfactin synthase thioesterase subunit [Clostridium acetobutylicum]|nr:surfactin synthase thioesterase subunit [Clostridium acetobutylicum]NYC94865.1 surfactin synthase thioesterase subunit [Clostridium acetobutylicum]OOL95300.1 hypothetical protein CLACE_36800 [Clostridium acetobutylicum]
MGKTFCKNTRLITFEGNHFFINDDYNRTRTIDLIKDTLL